MFKKQWKISLNNLVSGKDKKKLRKDMSKHFDEECLDHFFKNNDEISCQKVQGSKMQLYFVNEIPFFIDQSGKGDLFPSIYFLMAYPDICPQMLINQGVEKFIYNGANLMWAGVQNQLLPTNFKRNDIFSVVNSQNQYVAVGSITCNFEELQEKNGQMDGVAIHILHYLNDQLWECGPKKIDIAFQLPKNTQIQNIVEQLEGSENIYNIAEIEQALIDSLQDCLQEEAPQDIEDFKKASDQDTEQELKNEIVAKDEFDDDDEEGDIIPIEIMDEYIMEAFMNALVLSVNSSELPLDGSKFYQNHMLLCKRESVKLDLKNSSHKKIGKFFTNMAKLGIIDYKEKKGAQPCITKIHQNSALQNWKPTISCVGIKEDKSTKKQESDEKWPKVEIKDVFKVKPTFKKAFLLSDENKLTYTKEELKNNLLQYLKENCKSDKKMVILDPYLCQVFKVESGQILKEELMKTRMEETLLPFHQITNLETGKSETKSGYPKGIVLTAEKRHNKNVTSCVGLELYGFNIDKLSSKFQIKFASSVSYQELASSPNNHELVVQGKFIDEIENYLVTECKINQSQINIIDKLKKKKKPQ